jgi:hypothetical protein
MTQENQSTIITGMAISATDKFCGMLTVSRTLAMIEQGLDVAPEQVEIAYQQLLVMCGVDNEEQILNCGELEIVQWYSEMKNKLSSALKKTTPLPYSNVADIIYSQNPEIAEELFNYLREKGYSVGVSTVEIVTGTQGNIVVKKLDVYK